MNKTQNQSIIHYKQPRQPCSIPWPASWPPKSKQNYLLGKMEGKTMRIFSPSQIIKRNPWIAYLFGILLILAILKTCINQALNRETDGVNFA